MNAENIVVATLAKGDGEVRITLGEYRGRQTVDLRLFESFTPAKVPMPTKRGITLSLDRLPELARAILAAEAKAREVGLLPSEAGE